MVIDHVGLVVQSLEDGIQQWEKTFGYKQSTEIVINTRQKVKVVFLDKEGSLQIKLIEPVDETSPIFLFAKRGGGLHHLCFKCENLNEQISSFDGKTTRVLVQPQPGEAFDNENIAFALAKNNLNIELIDTNKRAKRL
ncbi:MAG: hypothetical protein HC896_07325 [Bacteroidales bacterium]|nr:hypothetical protein [Bacteroidales bacterium]